MEIKMKKSMRLIIKITLSVVLIGIFVFITNMLEYWKQIVAVDNLVGAVPLILIITITALLLVLVWKKHKRVDTLTISLSILTLIFGLLLIPAMTGNWYPFAKVFDSPKNASYSQIPEDIKLASLSENASLHISGSLPTLDGATALYPVYTSFANAVYDKENITKDTVVCSNTANAYKKMIDGECDIIFVAGSSEKQKKAATEAGAELVYTAIGREAFVFLVAKSNPIDGLTHQQLKNIYSGKTANWKTLGWKDGGKMIAFKRPEGSGSQTGLQNIMGNLPIQKPQPLADSSLIGHGSMMSQISAQYGGVQPAIGYSYRYYANTMYHNPDSKILTINGVYPSKETIINGSYPFTANFYAVTNGQPMGNTKRFIDWILSEEGQFLIEESGYVPLK